MSVTTQPPHGGFFNFTSFICLLFVNTEYIKQCGGDNMVDRKVILNAYKKGPEAVISLFEETFSKLERRIEELENASKKTLQTVINHLLQMVCVSLLPRVCANRLIVKQVASWATRGILLV